ncbi:MAG: response regulator [Thermodesulfobacteriota bacterium]|nr:response regulator [Thermodesulfobacteriota bacterium]
MSRHSPATTEANLPNILIIEDNAAIRKMLALFFEKYCSCNVTIVASGHEAAEIFHADTFNVVITDIAMPDMDGNELARHILKVRNDLTKILAITGTPGAVDRTLFDGILYKPFSFSKLKNALTELCNGIQFKSRGIPF